MLHLDVIVLDTSKRSRHGHEQKPTHRSPICKSEDKLL